jgi:hypothetical protein
MALIITLPVSSQLRVLRVFASLVIGTPFIRTLCEHREKLRSKHTHHFYDASD